MKSKCKAILLLLLVSLSACTQVEKTYNCTDRIDQLYALQKIHLIFCSYYSDKVIPYSGADTLLDNLSFYRDTVNAEVIGKEDSKIIANLKSRICSKDTTVIAQIEKWCIVSRKIAQIRTEVDFTIEGYMEFLNEFEKTKSIINPFLKEGRTIYSLSTYEMEEIYFASIGVITLLGQDEQVDLFKKLRKWDFK